MTVVKQQFSPIRTERFIHTLIGWYVRTREQVDLGPFADAAAAETALKGHLDQYRDLNRPRTTTTLHHGMDIHDPAACRKSNCAVCMEARIVSQSMGLQA
ncbi:DUF6316 family protein [Marinobacter fonticola]|uniref:DUF6316 family protein n=1 Tax=Marinobacter fonticola TaxID=2603215 RepID=UPI0011E85EB9|nr:DUF6316 family protein [Marinobacter fonticola]